MLIPILIAYIIIGVIVYVKFPWGNQPEWERVWESAFWPCLAILQVIRCIHQKL